MPSSGRRKGRPPDTFLEYVCERLLGPPARRTGTYGESYWLCPFHNDSNPSFHTMPDKSHLKHRWMCFGCGMRGDAADLMKERIPGEDWPTRKRRLDQWRHVYEQELKGAQAGTSSGTAPTSATPTPAPPGSSS